jgi:hypothetical protein
VVEYYAGKGKRCTPEDCNCGETVVTQKSDEKDGEWPDSIKWAMEFIFEQGGVGYDWLNEQIAAKMPEKE